VSRFDRPASRLSALVVGWWALAAAGPAPATAPAAQESLASPQVAPAQ